MRQRVIWNIPAPERIHPSRDLYAMDIREVARRLNMSRGLVFMLEKSALQKLRNNGRMKELLDLVAMKKSC